MPAPRLTPSEPAAVLAAAGAGMPAAMVAEGGRILAGGDGQLGPENLLEAALCFAEAGDRDCALALLARAEQAQARRLAALARPGATSAPALELLGRLASADRFREAERSRQLASGRALAELIGRLMADTDLIASGPTSATERSARRRRILSELVRPGLRAAVERGRIADARALLAGWFRLAGDEAGARAAGGADRATLREAAGLAPERRGTCAPCMAGRRAPRSLGETLASGRQSLAGPRAAATLSTWPGDAPAAALRRTAVRSAQRS